ncbi:MarR family transcriptional regulator [Devosia neptuniae]|jgi:DNA-binding MarR family transcriptional regulator|uniref:MarR family winged helix-turn-helix transcriptional regulator n=1 Tax=Devosia TaxID=46913 RepID=UPI0022AEA384|nr:MarR family transcriptional regulator [Devosia neptuniae]MCZ4347561.1 MarR family transcriptional regulator [Devosia neptuniae]|tara:strand:- start:58261 stop:58740 length:480 start_codon:yes stop_codon:yes gene_type:complete
MDDVDKIRAQWARQCPDLDTAPMGLIGRLARVSQHMSQAMAANFAAHGLSSAGFDVLATLLRSGPPHALSPGQLLATMMVTSGTMTNRIDQLEKDGLVARQRSLADKRSYAIGLTERGRAAVEGVLADHVKLQADLVAILPEDERVQLDGLLRSYLARI